MNMGAMWCTVSILRGAVEVFLNVYHYGNNSNKLGYGAPVIFGLSRQAQHEFEQQQFKKTQEKNIPRLNL